MKNSFRSALQLLFLMATLAAIGCHAEPDDPDAVTSGDGDAGPRGPKTGDLRGAESADGGGYEWIFCPRGCQSDPKGSFCK